MTKSGDSGEYVRLAVWAVDVIRAALALSEARLIVSPLKLH